jgi:hypothetical protein
VRTALLSKDQRAVQDRCKSPRKKLKKEHLAKESVSSLSTWISSHLWFQSPKRPWKSAEQLSQAEVLHFDGMFAAFRMDAEAGSVQP